MIVGAIGHGISPAMPVMPVLGVYRACESPSIILKPRSTKTRRRELFSGAVAMKIASFDHRSQAVPRPAGGPLLQPGVRGSVQTWSDNDRREAATMAATVVSRASNSTKRSLKGNISNDRCDSTKRKAW